MVSARHSAAVLVLTVALGCALLVGGTPRPQRRGVTVEASPSVAAEQAAGGRSRGWPRAKRQPVGGDDGLLDEDVRGISTAEAPGRTSYLSRLEAAVMRLQEDNQSLKRHNQELERRISATALAGDGATDLIESIRSKPKPKSTAKSRVESGAMLSVGALKTARQKLGKDRGDIVLETVSEGRELDDKFKMQMERLRAGVDAVTPGGAPPQWFTGIHPCRWSGITCNDDGGVSMVQLQRAHGIPPRLFDQEYIGIAQTITGFACKNCRISEIRPYQFAHLPKLRRMSLVNSAVEYIAPRAFFNSTQLAYFNARSNFLREIPPDLLVPVAQGGAAESLASLVLKDNRIEKVPETIDRLARMALCDLSENHITSVHGNYYRLKIRNAQLQRNRIEMMPDVPADVTGSRIRELALQRNRLRSVPEGLHRLPRIRDLLFVQNYLTALPPSLGLAENIRVMDFSRNKLESVPPEVFMNKRKMNKLTLKNNSIKTLPVLREPMPNLINVDVSQNHITTLFGNMTNLGSVKYFLISFNPLRKVPDDMVNLKSLSNLAAEGCGLVELPEWIGKLPLERLHLQANKLKTLPESYGELVRLSSVKFHMNKLETLPDSFTFAGSRVRAGVSIDLSHNRLRRLPSNFGDKDGIKVAIDLLLHMNMLEELPDSLGNLELKYYTLSYNRLTTISEPVMKALMSTARTCNLEHNRLEFLPEIINPVAAMHVIKLDNNRLTTLPSFMASIKTDGTSARNNRLTRIPSAFINVQATDLTLDDNLLEELPELKSRHLKKLSVKNNRLHSLPMMDTPRLEYLAAGSNFITALPEWLNELRSLVELYVPHNRITSLPESMSEFRKLQMLDVSGNLLNEDSSFPSGLLQSFVVSTDLSQNQLKSVPPFVSTLPFAETILLHGNMIEDISSDFMSSNLKTLSLDSNVLSTFDMKYLRNTHVTTISLRNNKLLSVKPDPVVLSSLHSLHLSGNMITEFPLKGDVRNIKHIDVSHNRIAHVPRDTLADLLAREGVVIRLEANELPAGFLHSAIDGQLPERGRLVADLMAFQGSGNDGSDGEDFVRNVTASTGAVTWMGSHDAIHDGSHGSVCSMITASGSQGRELVLRRCQCDDGYYSVTQVEAMVGTFVSANVCKQCVQNAMCREGAVQCQGGFYLDRYVDSMTNLTLLECVECISEGVVCEDNLSIPKPGYWRAADVSGLEVFECKNKDACLGGQNSTANCRPGHHGQLCSLCDRGHYKGSGGLCHECPSPTSTILFIVLMGGGIGSLLLGLTLMGNKAMLSVLKDARKVDKDTFFDLEGAESLAAGGTIAMEEHAAGMKMLIGFLQVLAVLPATYEVQWPDWWDEISEYLSWVNLDFLSVSSYECMWEDSGYSAGDVMEYTFLESMALISLVPVIIVSLSLMLPLGSYLARKFLKPAAGIPQSVIINFTSRLILLVLLLTYLPISTAALQFFKCRSFDGGYTSYISADVSVQCYSTRWYAYVPVAVGSIVVYTIGLPLSIILVTLPTVLGVKKSAEKMRVRAGFIGRITRMSSPIYNAIRQMFAIYKPRFIYWESLELIRKLSVTALALHFGNSVGTYQVAISLLICFGAIVIHLLAKPFVSTYLNNAQALQLSMVYLTLSLGLLKATQVPDSDRVVFTFVVILLDVLVVMLILFKVSMVLWLQLAKKVVDRYSD